MAGHAHITVTDPGPQGFPKMIKFAFIAAIILGSILWLAGFIVGGSVNAWKAFLLAYCYFLMLGLGGMVFTGIQYCASARWSIVVRRLAEGFGAYVPISFFFFLIIWAFGWNTLYDVQAGGIRDEIDKSGLYYGPQKTLFLSRPMILIKGIIFYGVWFYFINAIRKNSLEQDKTKDKALFGKNVKLSVFFLMLFAYTFSLHCIDLLMALESKWFSTMFGVYCFAGLFVSTFSVLAMVIVVMRAKNSEMKKMIQHRHLHDLGTFMLAFSCFMMYIGFSQYMLIWYANIPEETFYIIERSENGWQYVFAALPVLKFVFPFFVLMPQAFRGNPFILVLVGLVILVGQWIDLYWLIYPVFFSSPVDTLGAGLLPEIGAFLALLGVFGVVLDKVYSSHSVVAVGDPYVQMSVDGSYL